MKHLVSIRREKGAGAKTIIFINGLLRRAILCALKARKC